VAARLLFGLLVMGVLEYDPPLSKGPFKVADVLRDHEDRQALERMQEQMVRQAYEQLRGQNAYEMLGVAPTASHEEIERSYEQTKSQFSRERILPRVRDKYRSELTLIESRLIEGYLTLTQPGRGDAAAEERAAAPRDISDLNVRVEMDRAKTRVQIDKAHEVADSYYAKGRRYMRDGDFHNAIQYGKLAVSHNPSDARYYYLLGDCLSRNPEARWQRMAEDNYTKATQLDPWNPEYWLSLGRLYKRQGLKLRAKKQFEEALKLLPNNAEILDELNGVG
jgi:tetratricopeptide (TPR) repeat protein